MKLIRIKDVVAKTGISRSYVYELCKQGLFPRKVELIPGGSSVAWVEDEINKWIEGRIKQRDQVDEIQILRPE